MDTCASPMISPDQDLIKDIAANISAVNQRIQQASCACGRSPEDIKLIGVSKTVDLDSVEAAMMAGVTDFGENRPSELARKHDAFPQAQWHFIGNIQSRQLNLVVGRATLIHSLCEASHADRIERLAAEAGIVQDVLIEINDGEDNKQGIDAHSAWDLLVHCSHLEHVRVKGLMIMAPAHDQQAAQETFAGLARLRDELSKSLESLNATNICLDELSMGMTDDYPLAIAQGATMVRVGRAVFSR